MMLSTLRLRVNDKMGRQDSARFRNREAWGVRVFWEAYAPIVHCPDWDHFTLCEPGGWVYTHAAFEVRKSPPNQDFGVPARYEKRAGWSTRVRLDSSPERENYSYVSAADHSEEEPTQPDGAEHNFVGRIVFRSVRTHARSGAACK